MRFATVDEYIAAFPEDVRTVLEEVRTTIRRAVPGADETISYQMPTVTLDGRRVVHFAAWKHHLSVYPVPAGDEDFDRDIAPYRAAKGTLRFPFGAPVPYDLIARAATLLAAQRWQE